MAWSIGSNDVANSMATAVGAKAITFRQAVLIAGVLNFVGAVFVGSHVTETIRGNIVKPSTISDPHALLLGFIASLLAAAIWVTLSTWKEMPISTTHSVVGALVGFGLIASGTQSINWFKLGQVASSWVLSPIVGCIIAFLVFRIIVKLIFDKAKPVESAKIVGPGIIGVTAFMIVSSLLMKTPLGEKIGVTTDLTVFTTSIFVGIIVALISMFLLRNIRAKSAEDYDTVERIFRRLQIVTSCYVAFSHGANDIANAIGPVAGIIPLASGQGFSSTAPVPVWLLALGGFGIAVGCLTWGHKVMRTLGYRITTLTNTRGFSVDFGAATTVLIASKLGMPISTSHTVVGAVIGVGLARGLAAVDLGIIKKIIVSWLLTVPVAAGTSALIFLLLKLII
ncbi:MAG: inorganic phosphate transporter [Thermoplasmata archaeon]|nr:MAG: inorganic phosphate transporter [Thermoplasmata archaeon]MCD6108366.1 inorganic phosphate transporter [Thermoplasmata archaeon]